MFNVFSQSRKHGLLDTYLLPIIIAILSPVITVYLSRNKFSSERLWERKVGAYERVIDAFYNSKKFNVEHIYLDRTSREPTQEEHDQLNKLNEESLNEISRATDVGSFLFSKNAIRILADYHKEKKCCNEQPDWYSYLEADLSLTNKYMEKFIEAAKEDLIPKSYLSKIHGYANHLLHKRGRLG